MWKNYADVKPYNYQRPSSVEDDPDYCWVLYQLSYFKDGRVLMTEQPYPYINGKFVGLDQPDVKIIAWCNARHVISLIADTVPMEFGRKYLVTRAL